MQNVIFDIPDCNWGYPEASNPTSSAVALLGNEPCTVSYARPIGPSPARSLGCDCSSVTDESPVRNMEERVVPSGSCRRINCDKSG